VKAYSTQGRLVILAGILGTGAFLRLYQLDMIWFFLDQVRDVSIASNIAAGRNFPLLGPGLFQTQTFLGPFYFYFLAIPFLFEQAPVGAAYFIAVSNSVALFVFYRFVKEFFGSSLALAATALFAVFPLAVISSRAIWNPGVLPLFTVLFMWALYSVVLKGCSRSTIALLALLAVLMQIHFTAVSFAALALLAFAVFRPKVRLQDALIGLALFLLLYSPYLYYEFSHRFENLKALLSFTIFDQALGEQRALAGVVKNVGSLFSGSLRGFIREEQWPPFFLKGFFLLYGLAAFFFTCGILLCLCRLLRYWKRPEVSEEGENRRTALLLMWLIIPILIVGSKKTGVWWYHLDLLYPSQFIFIAMALLSLPSAFGFPTWLQKALKRSFFGLLLGFVLFQGYFQFAWQQRVDRYGEMTVDASRLWIGSVSPPFGPVDLLPLGYRSRILQALLEDFALDEHALPLRVHGAILGPPDARERIDQLLARHLVSQITGTRRQRPNQTAHYLVAKGGIAESGPHALRSKQIGPFLILEYQPSIDYQSWGYVAGSRGTLDTIPEQGWKKFDLPAVGTGLELREGEGLLCRGILRIPSSRQAVRISISIVGETPLRVSGMLINGRYLPPVAQRVRESPSFSWNTETVFDLKQSFTLGENLIVFEVTGTGRIISLDVYEGRSLPPDTKA